MKKHIPNILTTYRVIVAIIIPFLFFNNNYNLLTVLFTLALLTDLIDGFLARKWNVTSNYGKIADMIGDKLLALSASSTFIIAVNKYFLITLILEFTIIVINSIKFLISGGFKNNNLDNHNSSIYGKAKTWALFISLFVGYIYFKFNILKVAVIPLIIITAIMQIITAINYAIKKDDKSSSMSNHMTNK